MVINLVPCLVPTTINVNIFYVYSIPKVEDSAIIPSSRLYEPLTNTENLIILLVLVTDAGTYLVRVTKEATKLIIFVSNVLATVFEFCLFSEVYSLCK